VVIEYFGWLVVVICTCLYVPVAKVPDLDGLVGRCCHEELLLRDFSTEYNLLVEDLRDEIVMCIEALNRRPRIETKQVDIVVDSGYCE
jgi:hypothetical protein